MGGNPVARNPRKIMEPSFIVLSALATLNRQLVDSGNTDYQDDGKGTAKLLGELWEVYYSSPSFYSSPGNLIDGWVVGPWNDPEVDPGVDPGEC